MRFPRKKHDYLQKTSILPHTINRKCHIPGTGRKEGDVYVTNFDQLHLPVFHT